MAHATLPVRTGEKYRAECIRWMTEFKPDLFVTFVFNRGINIDEAQRTFEKFHGYIDRKLIGRAFLRRPDKRSSYIATVEKPDTNIHIHALFRMSDIQKLRFCLIADGIWETLVKGGNLDIQVVHCAEGVADYITKELRPQTSDRLLLPRHAEISSSR
ncbi:hypothetical protein KRZ98_18055 [Sphingobium sp. AS12]|uniref:hypothetical protein n=1 Tax=Sphingobium sp. AS12 TaxID=2849495 RepID=UPI001C315C44|nr:hypothetical protein [Sphingobium sp. AS12]MBV2150149.1 hypothetical protein [Sphingobium sp. AS12]